MPTVSINSKFSSESQVEVSMRYQTLVSKCTAFAIPCMYCGLTWSPGDECRRWSGWTLGRSSPPWRRRSPGGGGWSCRSRSDLGLGLGHEEAGVVVVLVGVDRLELELSVPLPDPLVRLVGGLEGGVAGEEPAVPGVEAALLPEGLGAEVTSLHPHSVPSTSQVVAGQSGRLKRYSFHTPETRNHLKDVAFDLQPALGAAAALLPAPVVAGHRLALHQQGGVEQLLPDLLHVQLRPAIGQVGHDKTGIVPVSVGLYGGEVKAPALVPDEVAWLLDRLEGHESGEEMIHLDHPGALQPKLLVAHVPLLDEYLAAPVPNVSAGVGDGLEGDGLGARQPGAHHLHHMSN